MDLATELTELERKVATPKQEAVFNADYAELLVKLQGAMQIMKQLALAQATWLYGEAGQQGRLN